MIAVLMQAGDHVEVVVAVRAWDEGLLKYVHEGIEYPASSPLAVCNAPAKSGEKLLRAIGHLYKRKHKMHWTVTDVPWGVMLKIASDLQERVGATIAFTDPTVGGVADRLGWGKKT